MPNRVMTEREVTRGSGSAGRQRRRCTSSVLGNSFFFYGPEKATETGASYSRPS